MGDLRDGLENLEDSEEDDLQFLQRVGNRASHAALSVESPVTDEEKIDVMRCVSRLARSLLRDPLPAVPQKTHWWPGDSKQTWYKGDGLTAFFLYTNSNELMFQEVHVDKSEEPLQCKVRESGFFASWVKASWNNEVLDGQAGIQFEFDLASHQFIEKHSHAWKLWEGPVEAVFEYPQWEWSSKRPHVSTESPLSEEALALQGVWNKARSRDSFEVREAEGCVWFVEMNNTQALITVQDDGFRSSGARKVGTLVGRCSSEC